VRHWVILDAARIEEGGRGVSSKRRRPIDFTEIDDLAPLIRQVIGSDSVRPDGTRGRLPLSEFVVVLGVATVLDVAFSALFEWDRSETLANRRDDTTSYRYLREALGYAAVRASAVFVLVAVIGLGVLAFSAWKSRGRLS
jgi:hypothetical protein